MKRYIITLKSYCDSYSTHFMIEGEFDSIASKDAQALIIDKIANGELAYLFSSNFDEPAPTFEEAKRRVEIHIYEAVKKCDGFANSIFTGVLAKCDEEYKKRLKREKEVEEISERAIYETLKKKYEGNA